MNYLSPPSRFQCYRNINFICTTFNSHVYVSHISGTAAKAKVVLKFIPRNGHITEERIDAECRIQSSIHHPYIMPVNSIFDLNSKQPYRVIEMPHASFALADMHAENLFSCVDPIFKIMYQVTQAVSFLHNIRVLHGDLNPRNIVLMNNNKNELIPQIIDFGHACQFNNSKRNQDDNNNSDNYCKCNLITPSFSAPEQLLRKPHSFPSDIWSLGATFYFFITGANAVINNDNFALMVQMAKNLNLSYCTKFGSSFPKSGRILISQMMNFDPLNRPTAEDILDSEFFKEVLDENWIKLQKELVKKGVSNDFILENALQTNEDI